MGIFNKIKSAIRNNTTYRIGLLQSKAYRILKQNTQKLLEPYGISSVEWALLGLLFDTKEGLRSSALAEDLGVEAPFVTAMISNLKKKKWIDIKTDEKDSRAKILFLTNVGREFVQTTEVYMRKAIRPMIQNVSPKDLLAYLAVLEKIILNSK